MKMKRVISAIAAFAGLIGILPAAYASDLATNINDAEYLCFDLTSYANCVGFANSYEIEDGVIKDGVEFKVPNYIGVGQTETPLDFIYNKAAMDKKKETDGFVYDTEGTPYLISTELQSPNFPILGSAAYINNRTFTLDAGGKKLYELAFLTDVSADLYAGNFTLSIEYTDGTVKTDDDWVVKGIQANVSVITAHEGVESYVPFEVTPATEVNPDAAKETALKYKTNKPAEPWGVNQYIPAYKLELDPEKSVKNITFTNTAGSIALAVFGVTAKCVTKLDEIRQLIDSLPENDKINFGNYLNYKESVDMALKMITGDIVLDDERQTKITAIAEKIENYENNPQEGVIYLIDLLPEEEHIDENNFEEYVDEIEVIQKLYSEDMDIADEKIAKYLAAAEKIARLADEKKVKDLIDALPAADSITKDNYLDYSGHIAEIKALIEKGTAIDDEIKSRFEAVYNVYYSCAYAFDPFVTIDYAQQCNAIMYGNYGMTLDDPTVRTPYYIGTKNSDAIIGTYPIVILNKKAFDEAKNEEGLVYSEKLKIPFDIDTDRAIILGTDALNKTTTVTIPVEQGNYKRLYMTYYGTFRFDQNVFKTEIQYTDGTVTTNPEKWEVETQTSNKDNYKAYPYIVDCYPMTYDANKPYDTAPWFERNDRTYNKLAASTRYMPVLILEANPEKTVKSLKLTMQDPNRAMGVIAITAELPEMDAVKTIIENKIAKIDSTNLISNYDDIYAVANMLEKYQAAAGAQEIAGIDKFNAIKAEFVHSIVEVINIENSTTVREISSRIEFTNPIQMDKPDELVNVSLNNEKFTDYRVEAISEKEILITVKNDFDYNKKFTVVLSGEITSSRNKQFTLRNDYSYSFEPEAPFEILEFSINGAEVQDINAYKGRDVTVSMKLKNNTIADKTNYSMTLCLYGDNNKLEKVYLEQHALAVGEEDDFEYILKIPNDEQNYRIECYIWDGYTTMNKITQNISR